MLPSPLPSRDTEAPPETFRKAFRTLLANPPAGTPAAKSVNTFGQSVHPFAEHLAPGTWHLAPGTWHLPGSHAADRIRQHRRVRYVTTAHLVNERAEAADLPFSEPIVDQVLQPVLSRCEVPTSPLSGYAFGLGSGDLLGLPCWVTVMVRLVAGCWVRARVDGPAVGGTLVRRARPRAGPASIAKGPGTARGGTGGTSPTDQPAPAARPARAGPLIPSKETLSIATPESGRCSYTGRGAGDPVAEDEAP
jgi:hypothetical protein